MSQEELQKKYDHLVTRVRIMRGYQKEFFKYRASMDLKKARLLEREVDQLIGAEVQKIKSGQKELF